MLAPTQNPGTHGGADGKEWLSPTTRETPPGKHLTTTGNVYPNSTNSTCGGERKALEAELSDSHRERN